MWYTRRVPSTLPLTLCLCLLALTACETAGFSDESFGGDDLPAAGPVALDEGWQSAPMPTPDHCGVDSEGEGDDWLEFGGRQKLEIAHGLGRTPSLVLIYVSFERRGCGGTLASGDIARIDGVDDELIRLQNGTEEDFHVRLYLQ